MTTATRLLVAALLLVGQALSAAEPTKFRLTSADIPAGGTIAAAQVFNGFGCTGGNISPALAWENAPPETRSFALLVHDPDAPTGSGWWHWVVYNIPSNIRELAANAGAADGKALPAGAVQGRTDFGTRAYGGPCPPPGSKPHRYNFRLHALKVERLDLPEDATAALIGFNVNANTIARAELTGRYAR